MDIEKLPPYERIEELARRANAERSLYIGEMIGEFLCVTWAGLKSAAHWVVYSTLRTRPTH